MAPPRLDFAVDGVEAVPDAAAPTLRVRLRIGSAEETAVRSIALTVHVRIAAERRRYADAEGERLRELFGPPDDWPRSLGSVPWVEVAYNVPAFTGSTQVGVPVPCTYDFDVAAAKYLAALDGGDVPLELLFNGTLSYTGADGRLQMAMIPWDREASTRLPVRTWREAMDAAFPDSAWLRVHRDVFARLQAYRSRSGWASWEETLDALLDGQEGG